MTPRTFRQLLDDYHELAYHYDGQEYVEKCQQMLDTKYIPLNSKNSIKEGKI